MKRPISLLVLGIAVGSACTLLLDRWLSEPPTYAANSDRWRKALSPAGAGVGDAQLPELLSGTGSVAEQSAIALIAAQSDAAGIRERILEVVAYPPSARRAFALDLLIARYAEFDPGAAANLVHELDLDDSMLARVFAVWAELDDAGAMAALRQEIDEGRAVAIALAFAAKLGNDEQAADRVAAALPPSVDVDRFRIELIEQVAETAPERAMRMALALEKSATRSQALARVAAGWADADPAGGLRQAAGIENYGERQRFIGQLGRDWAGTDPDAVLRLIEAGGNDPDMRTLVRFAASTLAASRPRQALAIAADLEPQVANTLRSMALNAIAESDPLAAIELLRDIPASEHRKNMLRGIAQVYAHQDPDTALAWAESLPEHERAETLSAIVGSIAGTDPDRAVEISLALEDRARSHALHYIVMQSVYSLGNGEELGRRLLAIQDDDDREQAIGTFVSMWASQDPEATLDWILANDAATNSRTIGQVGRQLAQHDPRAALRMTGRLPAESREAWITQIAGSFAQADPQGAMAWLQQSQGQPHYEAALAAISRHSAHYDPQAVAALVPTIRDASAIGVEPTFPQRKVVRPRFLPY